MIGCLAAKRGTEDGYPGEFDVLVQANIAKAVDEVD